MNINRRQFLKWTSGSALALAFPFDQPKPPKPKPPKPAKPKSPNLLIVHTDEHNFRTLGCYRALLPKEQALMWGEAVVETPNIDWISKNGATCTSFYATTPVCSPSRASLISGQYPHNTPVNSNDIPLNDKIISFAEVLRRKGYATGYLGKWHLDGKGKPQWAPKRGFGFSDNRYMFNRGHWKQLEEVNGVPRVKARKKGKPSYSVKGADANSFTTDFLCDKTVEFIQAHKGEPFCCMVSLPDPHGPDTVRPPYDTMYKHQTYKTPRTFNKPDEGLPSWGAKKGKFLNMASYYGMVKCIDDNVGKLLDCLRKNGLMKRTIIVFTSDHGDLRGEHHRQNKGVPYEGSALIPFLIYSSGQVKPGKVVDEAMTCVDFKPTILGLMGVESMGPDEGRDCSKLLTQMKTPEHWNDIAFMRGTGEEKGWVAAVTRRYKLVYGTEDDPWLFDLEKDPDELINFYTDKRYRDTVRRMSLELRDYGQTYQDPRLTNDRIQGDLKWGIQGKGPYSSNAGETGKRKKKR